MLEISGFDTAGVVSLKRLSLAAALKKARERRDAERKLVADGIDPSAQRKAAKVAQANSVELVSDEWLSKQTDLDPGTVNRHRGRLEKFIFPYIGKRPISAVTAPDLLAPLRRIESAGKLDTAKRTAALTFNAKEMKVLDEGVKDSERADIDQTMKSDKVLDVQRFPEIRFVSTSITPQSDGRYQVRGDLTLHGATRPVEFPITFSKDRYSGSVKLKQTDFGIAPVSIAGGTVKVKDVIEVVFEIVPARN